MQEDRPEQAIDAYDKAIQADPNFIDAYLQKALILDGEHRQPEALEVNVN